MNRVLTTLTICLTLLSAIAAIHLPSAHATSPGKHFDNIVVIAMENQPYNAVLGTGTGSSNAPFLQTMLPYSATVPAYHSYGYTASISGCSAACYTAVTSGNTYGVVDGVASGSVNQPNIFSSLGSWQAFCEDNCPRNADHFPALQYANTYQSSNTVFTCTTCSSTTVSYSQLISAANSATPSSLLWFTPTDSHNMHDNTIQTGDSYLQTLLVGSGTIASPASGSLLASTLFASGHRTLLMIWWDECGESNGQGYTCDSNSAAPNIFYGPNANVKQNFISTAITYDEYSVLRTIEDNFNLSPMTTSTYDNQAPIMSDLFTSTPPPPTSWNPNVNCAASIVRITSITDNMTGTNSYNNSPYSPGIQPPSGHSLDSAKRWLTPGQTGVTNPPAGWISPGPSCTVTNTHGQTVASFVEIDGVRWAGKAYEDCATTYYDVNGGGSMPPGNWCDNTFNIYDPSVVTNYGTSCTSATDPTCYGRIHLEFDRDWMAAGYCGTTITSCNNNTLFSTTTEQSTLIDVQGFVFWDAAHLSESWHSFNGWELHALTAWRPHNPTNPPPFTLTFQGYDYDGAQEETLTLNGVQLIQLPAADSPQNAGIYVNFNVTNVPLVPGTNTLVFTHANWDCGVTDSTKNVQVTNGVGTIIFSDPTERALNCTTSITYTINI